MKNGCHNRGPFSASYPVQDGWEYLPPGSIRPDAWVRIPVIKREPNRLSKDCRYSILTPNDPGCTGCKHHQSMNGGNGDANPTAPRGAHGPNGTPDDTSPHPE